jgi:putative transposase
LAKKKVEAAGLDLDEKRSMIDSTDNVISIRKQCDLLGLNRSSFYAPERQAESLENIELMKDIDRIYTKSPHYGSRKIRAILRGEGMKVGRKRIQRLMRIMGIQSIAPKPNTSKANKAHKVYPYLLRGLTITEANHVWATDITYIPTAKGFCYLVAVVDWGTRTVLSWRLSNTMDASFCVEALEEAIAKYGIPEIFNTDQGAQFTSEDFTSVLKSNGIKISMDGKGRALDNVIVERLWRSVKYECIYPQGFETMLEIRKGLSQYFKEYNYERPHDSLGNRMPMQVYKEKIEAMAKAA